MTALHDHLNRELERFRPYLERFNTSGPRYTSYPTALQFTEEFGAGDYDAVIQRTNREADAGPISLYTHLPFCEERCTFCGCFVVITKKKEIAIPYMEHLHSEIEVLASKLDTTRPVAQFHLGGGTPTYLTPTQLQDLVGWYRQHVTFMDDAEVSLEVDPRVTTEEHVDALVEAGFNRFSMGVQDFNRTVQEEVNRVQPLDDTRSLITYIRSKGVQHINIDLIYGLPHQTPESFQETVEQVIALRPTRLAVYSYAHVPWMKGNQKKFAEVPRPEGEAKFSLFLVARELFRQAGYVAIGFDHFALPDDELYLAQQERTLNRNFMGFTTHAGLELYGLGVSAISSVGNCYAQNVKKLPAYQRAAEAGELPTLRGLLLNRDDEVRRDLILQLFCNYYLDMNAFAKRWGIDFEAYFAGELTRLAELSGQNLVEIKDGAIVIEEMGRFFIRNICMIFDVYYESKGSQQRFSKTI